MSSCVRIPETATQSLGSIALSYQTFQMMSVKSFMVFTPHVVFQSLPIVAIGRGPNIKI